MKIIRKISGYKSYEEEADEIFRKAYNKLEWWMPFKFKLAKQMAIFAAEEVYKNLIHRQWVVLKTNAPKQREIVIKFWSGIIESIENIKKIEK